MSNIYDALSKQKKGQPGAGGPLAAGPADGGPALGAEGSPDGGPSTEAAHGAGTNGGRILPGYAARGGNAELEQIRQRVVLEVGADHTPVVVLTGAVPGEGTSTLALRFARDLAQAEARPVLLIDGDLAHGKGALSSVLQAGEESLGLSDLLAGGTEAARAVLGTELPNLHFLPSGRCAAAPLELVQPERMTRLMREFSRLYGFIVIDAGASLLAPETGLLASSTDGVILVVRANRTRREVAQRAVAALHKARCRVLGVILNDRRYPIPSFIYRRI